jgi:MerR family transcriptional regulator, light-induced transcriptional regulator
MDKKIENPIREVSLKTGLSPHLIRIWEKRYQAVSPGRSHTNRRYYSVEDVERLSLLRTLTEGGHRISQVAQLPLEELRHLRELIKEDSQQGSDSSTHFSLDSLLKNCVEAIEKLDVSTLEVCFSKASVTMAPLSIIEGLVIPLMKNIEERCRRGTLRLVNVQFTRAVIRPFLMGTIRAYNVPRNSPLLVTATPIGQLNELGSLFFMTAAAAAGWRSVYLGFNLPSDEIAAALHILNAKILALSISYPKNDPVLYNDLLNLHRLLPPETKILVGGEAADSYNRAIQTMAATKLESLAELQQALESLQNNETATSESFPKESK